MKAGVWHKDGPLAQIDRMADWADRSTPGVPLDDETAHKIATNLRAAVGAIQNQSQRGDSR
jgi:hypothetical protein